MRQGVGKAKTDDKVNELAQHHIFLFCHRKEVQRYQIIMNCVSFFGKSKARKIAKNNL